ncbi:MAG: DUF1524 domain-containing protein [Mycoplasmatales bacterium]|nr:DUF1524 domain-containing protein [Mycoplasmatales bacterium]
MFFVNSDFKKSSNQRNLREVIEDKTVKVAYGVLSLKNYYKMVKRIGGSEKIFIPKVQRGLVWKQKNKDEFIKNCIIGDKDNVTEPMPNIFLFCDKTTNEIQLFDGLQRTSSILNFFKNEDEILERYDVMIPAALFKGTRSEAETLFRNINNKGVKLNNFEKLASFGGEYEINAKNLSKDFLEKFEDFVENTTRQYKSIGLETSNQEKTTIYEILTYAIYTFSKSDSAQKIFPSSKKDSPNSFVKEWGYQVAYSTTASTLKIEYKKDLMLKNLLNNFSKTIEYNSITKIFNEELLEKYINKIIKALNKTESSIREIYQRNINSNNAKDINASALQSSALIGSIVVANYLNPKQLTNEWTMKWFLFQLISNRASSTTNKIVDELMDDIKAGTTTQDLDTIISREIIGNIEKNPGKDKHKKWLWSLFYIHYEQIQKKHITTKFEIDHIVPQSTLKKLGVDIFLRNDIGNLCLIQKELNRSKKDEMLHSFIKKDDKRLKIKEIAKTISMQKEEEGKYDMEQFKQLLILNERIEKHIEKKNMDSFLSAYKYFTTERRRVIKEYIEDLLK